MKRKMAVFAFFALLVFALPAFLSAVTITVTNPTGTSKWRGTQTIQWDATFKGVQFRGINPPGLPGTYKIFFAPEGTAVPASDVDPVAPWQQIGGSVQDDGAESSTYSANWDTSVVSPDGNYIILIRAYYPDTGFQAVETVTPAFLVDNTEPGIVVGYSPAAGSRNASGWYNLTNSPITVEITVTDADAGVRASNTVMYQVDGVVDNYLSAGSTDSSYTDTFIAIEGNVLDVFAYDDAVDNMSSPNAGYTEDIDYKVDLTKPVSNIAVNYANRTFSLAPADATSGIDWTNVWYEFVLDDDSIDGPYLYSAETSPVIPVGAKSLRVRINDIAGNEDDQTITFTSDRVISGHLKHYAGTALNGERVVLGGEVNITAVTDASC